MLYLFDLKIIFRKSFFQFQVFGVIENVVQPKRLTIKFKIWGYCGIKWFTPLYSSKKIYTSHNSSTPTSTPHHYSSISSSAPILDSISLYLHNFFVLFGLEIVYYTFFWEQKKCGKVVKNMFSKALSGTHIQAILIVKYSAKEIQKERYLCTTNLFIKVYFYNYFIWSWSLNTLTSLTIATIKRFYY